MESGSFTGGNQCYSYLCKQNKAKQEQWMEMKTRIKDEDIKYKGEIPGFGFSTTTTICILINGLNPTKP